MSTKKMCGCKGIRTCLLCEHSSNDSADVHESKEVKYVYTYCPQCDLCWPENEETASLCDFPLYVGKLKLSEDFVSEEEEAEAISAIDKIPWMPSQSGRRKQDFGPKVNFKKKKVKIGEFKGFPRFTKRILQKFQDVPELSDFQPVELCHLEYSPDRGSSIAPHVDDFWLWGERLVTINLGSSTVLTLVPFSNDSCKCREEKNCDSCQSCTVLNGHRKFSCSHKFQDKSVVKVQSTNDIENVSKNSKLSTAGAEEFSVSSTNLLENNISEDISCPPEQINPKSCKMSTHPVACVCAFCSTSCTKNTHTMCSVFRTGPNYLKAVVRIVLPPRSLIVLAGCARYNWYHEIKRQDVISRRLAMTFRELTAEFLDGGNENKLGKDLLTIANNFYDF